MKVDSSFDAFVEARFAALLRTAYLLTGDRQHAEDLVQTALLRAMRRWRQVRGAPEAYVRRVLINLSHDRIRSLVRRPREEPPQDLEALHGGDPGFDGVIERRVVTLALAQLPVRQRQVVVLRFFEDLPIEQTAELLGCSTGTVKSYTSRALSRLRELLAEDDTESLAEVPHAQ
ncbi:SigE family RNA polymerase sigma factor [Dactylosporangium sp. NPDC051484]|uniref:SigE family RNA polymerase sigma factor n=1 Tax=Dactylosporangium sp. NPDC051484 TaxID=3154942 RepID=UPI00344D165E